MRVFVITYCQNLELMYGSRLVFGSIRVGFPNAELSVIDNASLPEAREELKQRAQSVGADFKWTERQYPHATLIADLISSTPGTVAFVDPDVIFWQKVEGWDFGNALAAGQLIPEFADPYSQTLTAARLHTSFLWLPDTRRLLGRVVEMQRRHIDFSPFATVSFCDGGTWRRLDTGAPLYAAFKDEMHAFSEQELDCFDHLYCGSHLPLVLPHMPDEVARLWQQAHDYARSGNVQALQGIGREQRRLFSATSQR